MSYKVKRKTQYATVDDSYKVNKYHSLKEAKEASKKDGSYAVEVKPKEDKVSIYGLDKQ